MEAYDGSGKDRDALHSIDMNAPKLEESVPLFGRDDATKRVEGVSRPVYGLRHC